MSEASGQTSTYGPLKFVDLKGKKGLKQFFSDPWFQTDTIIVKPNWVTTELGGFTSSNTLRRIIEALDSHIIVTESLHIGRSMSLLEKGMPFFVDDKEVNWDWLLRGEGWRWLYDNPSWEWFKKDGHWEHILKEDRFFLDQNGFSDLFQDYDVEYVNVTDEIWNDRCSDPAEIRAKTESKYSPVQVERMYGFVPSKLYDHAGSTFISLARLKQYATFSLKNMFGLIPDPMRSWWHGPNDTRIASSIVDINKIYDSIFSVIGMCTSVEKTAISDPNGEYVGEYGGNYSIVDGFGFLVSSRDLVFLDTTFLTLTEGFTARIYSTNVGPIELAEKEGLGVSNKEEEDSVKSDLGHYVTLP